MSRKTLFSLLAVLVLASTAFAASSSSKPTYDINTLKGKVASVNGTAGLQIRFSAFIEEESEFEPDEIMQSEGGGAPELADFVGANITVNQDTGAAPQNETAIAVDPNNPSRIVGGANDYVTGTWSCTFAGFPCSAFGDGYSGTYYSNDGGNTWCCNSSDPAHIGTLIPGVETLVGGQYDAGGDPALAFDGQGNVYYAGLGFNRASAPNAVTVNKGTFDGAGNLTWGAPVFINQTNAPSTINDKEWIAVDSNPNSPFYGRVYVTWTRFIFNPSNGGYVQSPIAVSYSSNGGQTFTDPQLIVGNVLYGQGSNVTVGPDGTVYVFWDGSTRLATLDSIWMVKSKDGGATWSKPVAVSLLQDILPLPGTAFRVNSYPAGAVAPNGDLYVSWTGIVKDSDGTVCGTRSYNGCHAAALYSKSTDGGATWSTPAPVLPAQDAATQAANNYPAPDGLQAPAHPRRVDTLWPRIAITPTGRVYMSAYAATQTVPYLSGSHYVHNALLDFVVTNPGTGVTNTVSTKPLNTRYQFGGQFIGDYTGLAAGSDEQFHAFWNTTSVQLTGWWFGTNYTGLNVYQNQQDVVTAAGQF